MAVVVKKTRRLGAGGGQPPSDRATSPLRPYFAERTPACSKACPNHHDIRAVIMALAKAESHGKTTETALEESFYILADKNPLAAFLRRVGFADQPYRSVRKLRAWVESRSLQDSSAQRLLALLPEAPYEQLPPLEKPVQLIKKNPPTAGTAARSPNLVMPTQPGNALQDAILAARIGNRDQALVLLLQTVEREPRNADAWLWLSRVVETDGQRIECLRRVIEINPTHQIAQADLARLTG